MPKGIYIRRYPLTEKQKESLKIGQDKLKELRKDPIWISRHIERLSIARSKIKRTRKGIPHSPEAIAKIKVARSKQIITEEHKRNISNSSKGRIMTSSQRLTLGKSLKKSEAAKQARLRANEGLRQKWKEPEFRNRVIPNILKGRSRGLHIRPNKLETSFKELLDTFFPNQWEYVGNGDLIIANKCPDFRHKKKSMLIEVFGDYWHEGEEPQSRINIFRKCGYPTLVIWEHELKDVERVVTKIRAFSNGDIELPIIESNRLYLRPVCPEDVDEHYISALNDPEILRFLECRFVPQTKESILEYVTQCNNNPDISFFAICDTTKPTKPRIGQIKLGPINRNHSFSEVGLCLTDKSHWNKGYGSEAIRLVTGYAFHILNIHKCTAGIYEDNIASVKAFVKADFVREAVLKSKYMIRFEEYTNEIVMSLFAKDYQQDIPTIKGWEPILGLPNKRER